jgi:hypothetical protein
MDMVTPHLGGRENYLLMSKKKKSWIEAKQKLSRALFKQRIKTGSCINYGEQCHIFEACTKTNPS